MTDPGQGRDELESDYFGQPHEGYDGIPNAFAQYGVSALELDTTDEPVPRRVVTIHTFMCETTLDVDGATELVRRLERAIAEMRR